MVSRDALRHVSKSVLLFVFVILLQNKILYFIFLNSKLKVCRKISQFPWNATKYPHL